MGDSQRPQLLPHQPHHSARESHRAPNSSLAIKQQGQYLVMQGEPGEYMLIDKRTGEILESSGSHSELIRHMSELYWTACGQGRPGRKAL